MLSNFLVTYIPSMIMPINIKMFSTDNQSLLETVNCFHSPSLGQNIHKKHLLLPFGGFQMETNKRLAQVSTNEINFFGNLFNETSAAVKHHHL